MPDRISSQDELREHFGAPLPRSLYKQMDRLDKHCRHFISLSPFLILASSSERGADASPKGDAPGFVAVIDDHTILIPDRPGNNRVDSLTNIVDNPSVGLLFLVPGIGETLRINGQARITTDTALLEPLAVRGKTPRTGLIVEIKEVYLHCAKALIRSKLWEAETKVERSCFPTFGRILADQTSEIDDVEEADRAINQAYRDRLY
jgi:hypothetical protein